MTYSKRDALRLELAQLREALRRKQEEIEQGWKAKPTSDAQYVRLQTLYAEYRDLERKEAEVTRRINGPDEVPNE